MNQVILCVGPKLPPIHGQSLAFTRFYESINNGEKLLVNTNMEDSTRFDKIFGTFKTLFLIFYKIFFLKIDVVYFTCSRSFMGSIKDIFLINLASFKNIKLINHLHGSDFYDFLHSSPKWYKKILFNAYSKVDTSIVLLESMKNQFEEFNAMNIEVIPNFYDEDLNIEIEVKDKNKINILYLSNIIKSKGIFELIDAFDRLTMKYDNIYLNIAGGFMGDEYISRDEIKKQFLAKIKINSKINYLGKVYSEDKVKLLQRSDIFVLPSYYRSEAFPISIIEAMRCGNAIITTNYKYLPDIVNRQSGILIKPKSIDSLVYAIEGLLEDHNLLIGMQEHNSIEAEKKYNLNQYIGKLNKIVFEDKL